MVAGLRSLAKAMELPPAPTVRAPAPDPTDEGWAPAMAPGYSTLTGYGRVARDSGQISVILRNKFRGRQLLARIRGTYINKECLYRFR